MLKSLSFKIFSVYSLYSKWFALEKKLGWPGMSYLGDWEDRGFRPALPKSFGEPISANKSWAYLCTCHHRYAEIINKILVQAALA
jgi:hypothetical protein